MLRRHFWTAPHVEKLPEPPGIAKFIVGCRLRDRPLVKEDLNQGCYVHLIGGLAGNPMPAEIINVLIGRNRDGWYIARSDELPGLFVAHPEIDSVVSDIPDAIRALYKADFDQEVRVIPGSYRSGHSAGLPWITIPADGAKSARC